MALVVPSDYHALLHQVPILYITGMTGLVVTLRHRPAGFRLAALDSDLHTGNSLASIGIRKAGDNIVGSPLPDGFKEGRFGR
jgi:hypothetical protein